MKAKRFGLYFVGGLLILASLFMLLLFIASFDSRMEDSDIARIFSSIFFVGLMLLSVLCFKAARRMTSEKPDSSTQSAANKERHQDAGTADYESTPAVQSAPASAAVTVPSPASASEKTGFWANHQVDYVLIANSTSRTKAGSAIARGVVGGVLLGPVGLLAAASAKKSGYPDLIVHYKSGRVATRRVKVNSAEYRSLARYIKG